MSVQTVTLHLPKTIYETASRTAEAIKRPVEEVLVTALNSFLPDIKELPSDLKNEMAELENFGDAQLWTIAHSTMPKLQRQKLSRLLQKNQAGTISEQDRQLLEDMVTKSERMTLKKARAYVLLKWRGHPINAMPKREQDG
jgi:hypothetical protein